MKHRSLDEYHRFLDSFAHRFRAARQQRGMLADSLVGVSAVSVRAYEAGKAQPTAVQLGCCALALRISSDWLLGSIGNDAAPQWREYNEDSYLCRDSKRARRGVTLLVGRRLRAARKLNGSRVSQYRLAQQAGISSVHQYEQGHVMPRAFILRCLTRELGVACDWLIGLAPSEPLLRLPFTRAA